MDSSCVRRVVLGRVSGLFGVSGWIKLYSYTEPREAILQHDRWQIGRGEDWVGFSVTDGRRQGKSVIAQLDGVANREQARDLIDCPLAVDRQQLPATGAKEFYWADLTGLQVLDLDGSELGVVDHLLETGANDVLVVRGQSECLVPFVLDEVVKEVDLEHGLIRVDWDPEY